MNEIIKYIKDLLNDVTLNEEDYIDALYKILNDLKELNNDKLYCKKNTLCDSKRIH